MHIRFYPTAFIFWVVFCCCVSSFHLHSMFKLILILRNWVSLWPKIKYPQINWIFMFVCIFFRYFSHSHRIQFVWDCTVSMAFIISLKIEMVYWHRPDDDYDKWISYINRKGKKNGSTNACRIHRKVARTAFCADWTWDLCCYIWYWLQQKVLTWNATWKSSFICCVCDCAELIYRFIVWSHACGVFLFFLQSVIFLSLELLIVHALLFSFLFDFGFDSQT